MDWGGKIRKSNQQVSINEVGWNTLKNKSVNYNKISK